MRLLPLLLLPVLAVAGCAAESTAPPVSTSRTSSGPSSIDPQSPNSLPRGSSVQAPLTGPVGNIGTTRVGPATAPVRSAY